METLLRLQPMMYFKCIQMLGCPWTDAWGWNKCVERGNAIRKPTHLFIFCISMKQQIRKHFLFAYLLTLQIHFLSYTILNLLFENVVHARNAFARIHPPFPLPSPHRSPSSCTLLSLISYLAFYFKKSPLNLSAAHIHVGLGLFTEALSTNQRPHSKEMTSHL